MAIDKELLDRLLEGRDRADLFAKDGLLDDLKKALSERILDAELDEHLDGERDHTLARPQTISDITIRPSPLEEDCSPLPAEPSLPICHGKS